MPGSGLPPGLTTGLLTVEEAAVSSSRSGAAPSCQEPGAPRGGGSLGPVYSAVQCSTGRLSRDQYSAVQCSTGGMTSALLASQICVTTVLSLAKQRVNCPHACKINNMKGMNTFYLLLNYYRLLPMNKYAILFTRPDLHSPLHAAYRETEISRYHFYDLPVPNGQGINRATVSVLPCPHQTREMVKW